MSDLFFVYFCLHICIHYSLMAFMKCEGAFSNIVFQKMICHKSQIYLCNSVGHGCRCLFQILCFRKLFATRATFMIFVSFNTIFMDVFSQKKPEKQKKLWKNLVRKKIKRTLFLQTLEIPKKLLQIYCYQNFCSNALTVTLFKSYLSNSNFVKKLLKSYCSNLLLQ